MARKKRGFNQCILKFSPEANKAIKSFGSRAGNKILDYMEKRIALLENPRSVGEPLKGKYLWRYRSGDYRILCEIQDNAVTILVVSAGNRKEIYKSK